MALPIKQKIQIVTISLVMAGISFYGNAQSFYSLQSAVITARSNSPLLKAEGYNINIAQGNLTTAKLHTIMQRLKLGWRRNQFMGFISKTGLFQGDVAPTGSIKVMTGAAEPETVRAARTLFFERL